MNHAPLGRRSAWLRNIASGVVRRTMDALPEELQPRLKNVAITIASRPSAALLDEDEADEVLGLFVGCEIAEVEGGYDEMPPEIFIFVENIWEYVEEDPVEYKEEVARTLLHEIGHYLGLDEEDLVLRDLD